MIRFIRYMENEELKNLMEENLKLTKEIHAIAKKLNRHIIWQQVFGFVKILIIAVPIVLGIIYLPPLLEKVYQQYSEVMDLGDVKNQINIDELKNLIPQLKK